MPDQSSAADEHAILAEITAPLASLPDDVLPAVTDVDFPRVLRGYDPLAVDAYVRNTAQLVAELQSTRSPEAAVRRALERVGEQISGILQRAHETAEQITVQSRREAEDRLEQARHEAAQIAAGGEQRIKDLDADADRIWAERLRIIEDARELAAQLLALADAASERFPPAEDTGSIPPADLPLVDAPAGEEPEATGAADAMIDAPVAAPGDLAADAPADARFDAPAGEPGVPAHEAVLFDAEADEGAEARGAPGPEEFDAPGPEDTEVLGPEDTEALGPEEAPAETAVLPDDTEATRVMPAVPRAPDHDPAPSTDPEPTGEFEPHPTPQPDEPHTGPRPDEPPAGV